MAPDTTTPDPGRMTVPPLFGWDDIVTVLVLVIAAAVVFLLLAALGSASGGRRELQALLAARSRRSPAPLRAPVDEAPVDGVPAGPAGPPGVVSPTAGSRQA